MPFKSAINAISDQKYSKNNEGVIKHYVGFKTWNDVAQEMNITYKTVMNSHHYAMTKLTRILAHLIERIEVYRGYHITVKFYVALEDFQKNAAEEKIRIEESPNTYFSTAL